MSTCPVPTLLNAILVSEPTQAAVPGAQAAKESKGSAWPAPALSLSNMLSQPVGREDESYVL